MRYLIMQVQQVMSTNVHYVPSTATLAEAATMMREIDTGFLPIGDSDKDKLQGVITDRDIVVRAIALGKDPQQVTVTEAKTDKVLYCYQGDSVEEAAENMRNQQVYRLIVLNDEDNKRLCGVISLGDIVRHDREKLGGEAARDITEG
jgi:CBS domain-containing protein